MAESTQLFAFAKTVKDTYTYEERVEVLEMLWSVAYTDGQLHDYEASLLRRVAGLIYVTDRDNGAARIRARTRIWDERGA